VLRLTGRLKRDVDVLPIGRPRKHPKAVAAPGPVVAQAGLAQPHGITTLERIGNQRTATDPCVQATAHRRSGETLNDG
jgi:hypothetical protein